MAASMYSFSTATSVNSDADVEKHPVPQAVGVALRVGLGDHGQSLAPRAGQVERETQDPLDASAGVDGRLHRHLVGCAGRERSAVVDVFAFGVFPHDDQVDRLFAAQRAEHAAESLGRPNVRIKIKRLTQLNQRQRARRCRAIALASRCSQEDRVKASERGQEIFRRHPSVTVVVGHAPVKALAVEMESADDPLGSFDHRERGVHDFRSDSVTRIKCDFIRFQRIGFLEETFFRTNQQPTGFSGRRTSGRYFFPSRRCSWKNSERIRPHGSANTSATTTHWWFSRGSSSIR